MSVYTGRSRGYSSSKGGAFAPQRQYGTSPSIEEPPKRDLLEGLLPGLLNNIGQPVASAVSVDIEDLQCIGSYNWVNNTKPTIIVPGSPPIWKNKSIPFRLQRDHEICYIDQNGHRLQTRSLLPLFRAVDIIAEDDADADIDWREVDIVTDRNGLRKLLRWIDSRGDGDRPREFRIDLQLAGENTVLMSRWEQATWAPPSQGFGFSFEEETTIPAPGCEKSTGHHRIVQYKFGGLNMVVRFEVDACLEALPTRTAGRVNVDDMISQLGGLSLSSTSTSSPSSTTSNTDVSIIRAGKIVPQSSILEMTTRSERNVESYDWKESYPQLYLSQTPHHFLAVHRSGMFNQIKKRNLEDREMKEIHAGIERSFRKLNTLLKTIQELVIGHGQRGRLSLVCKDGALKVHERKSQDSFLPDEVIRRFGL
ncbi:hypothetical protein QCA50_006594 [Cerrena zonata]|uniref:Geranylgeranyl pyrophosphate synthetase n=1 Tax=Cerrena zonata TaxID=2478898 RepID=A0AAW0GE00_9APHY